LALTVAATQISGFQEPHSDGPRFVRIHLLTLTSTYVTGGHPSTAADLFIPTLADLILIEFPAGPFTPTAGTTCVFPKWSPAAGANRGLIQFFWTGAVVSTAMAEVTNATSLSTFAGIVKVTSLS
jgi:hypothetical protein